jgi:hypothetical protein
MTRNLACSLALGALALVVPTASSAQTFVDVGVWTRGGGGRVVIGGAPVYGVPVYPAPVYAAPVYPAPVYPVPVYAAPVYRPAYVVPRPVYVAQPYYGHYRGRHRGWAKKGYAGYGPYAAAPYYAGQRGYRRR